MFFTIMAVDWRAIFPTVAKMKGRKGMIKIAHLKLSSPSGLLRKKEKMICEIVEMQRVNKSHGKRPKKCLMALVSK